MAGPSKKGREALTAIDRAMLERAQNDLDALEDTLASVADGGSLPAIDGLIRDARVLIDLLQSECQPRDLMLEQPPIRLSEAGCKAT
jgi:hypothetical protein